MRPRRPRACCLTLSEDYLARLRPLIGRLRSSLYRIRSTPQGDTTVLVDMAVDAVELAVALLRPLFLAPAVAVEVVRVVTGGETPSRKSSCAEPRLTTQGSSATPRRAAISEGSTVSSDGASALLLPSSSALVAEGSDKSISTSTVVVCCCCCGGGGGVGGRRGGVALRWERWLPLRGGCSRAGVGCCGVTAVKNDSRKFSVVC